MPLIKCPECGREVSTAAKACPNCGFPVAEQAASAAASTASASPTVPTEAPTIELLAEVRTSWWRYFWYLLFAWLVVPFIIAWVKRSAVVLRIYRDRITLEQGILSKCERELFIRDIRSVDIDQSFMNRIFNIGDLTISTAASADATNFIAGVPNPQQVRDLIIARRQGSEREKAK